METTEFALIAALARSFETASARRVARVGIGDDAAVLSVPRGALVWTVDASVEAVHFDRRWLSLEAVGRRAFHAAVSDVAAMGARPLAALSALVVPSSLRERDVLALARGQARAAAELACPIVGGNVARGGELSITTTVVGTATRPLTRRGARPGDELWLLGDVGLAGAGFRWLSSRKRPRRPSPELKRAVDAAVRAWSEPRALVREGRSLVGRARALIDVSDGLAGDAGHLAEAGAIRVVLEEGALRRALRRETVLVAAALGADALDVALRGGEDYCLVAAGPAAKRPRGARRIGRVERGRGVFLATQDGEIAPVSGSFDHFRGPRRRGG